jgi:uncharacterized protein YndB with AHSA1/START domain/DNA-binding transcriptional ArsR family regulator
VEAAFKALAAASRRKILDALFREDGQSLTALCENVSMSRQGLSKHLRVLEDAGLILTEFRGREKLHYLNPVPVREITERWLAKYSEAQLGAITALKKAVEGDTMDNNKRFAYQAVIRAPRERVWEALTSPEFTSQYFHATHIDSTWEPGAPVYYRYAKDGDIAVDGEVIEIDPPNRLVISWHVRYDERATREAPSRVTFTLTGSGEQTRLRVVHDEFPDDTVLFEGISEGWPWILSSLKSLMETGEALPPDAA